MMEFRGSAGEVLEAMARNEETISRLYQKRPVTPRRYGAYRPG